MKTELLNSSGYSGSFLAALVDTESTLSISQFDYDNNPNNGSGRRAEFSIGDGGGDEFSVDEGQTFCGRYGHFMRNFCAKTFRRKTVERKFPILQWFPEYNTEKLVADIIAGFTVGLMMLPQGLAYATVAGLPPQYGLYSGFVGCFVHILLGGTEVVTVGPTAVLSIITFTYTHDKPVTYAVFLCFITGVVTLLMGLLQLGFIVNFISAPVNSAFTSAAAITICSTQITSLLGLKFAGEGFIPTMKGALSNIWEVKLGDSLLSLACITTLLVLMKLQLIFSCVIKQWPGLSKPLWFISTARNAIVVIASTALAAGFGGGKEEHQPFTIVGEVVPGFPEFKLPPFQITDPRNNATHGLGNILEEEASAIIVMPLLAIMEHITIAKVFEGEKMIDASQEMISIGVSNIIGAFFSSMPVSGSFCRTSVNQMSGARSPLGGLITGTIVILALHFLTPYFYFIPKASLAAVIVCAVIFTVDIGIFKPMWRSNKMDFIPWSLTFLVSLFIGLEFGILTGFLVSVTYLLYYAARPEVKVKKGITNSGNEFLLVEMDRSLTFPSVSYIRYVISKASQVWGKNQLPVVVNCLHIQFADYTAAVGLKEVFDLFKKRDQLIILWQVKPSIIKILNGVLMKEHHHHSSDNNDDGSTDENVFFCRSEADVENIIDERFSEEEGKLKILQIMNRNRDDIDEVDNVNRMEVHTPHPTTSQRDKYSTIPLN